MKVTAIGIDLAKSVFQVHGVDERGHVVVRKQLRRDQVAVIRVSAIQLQGATNFMPALAYP
jgi:transposase